MSDLNAVLIAVCLYQFRWFRWIINGCIHEIFKPTWKQLKQEWEKEGGE